jgi:putative DNA primase/helicase
MPLGGPTATTLWGAHAHALDAFVQSPRLNLCSAESGSGKTTTFDVLAPMVPRALRTENLKPAILFRVVEKHRPTLLLDEVDTYLAPDLVLNCID